MGKSKKAATTTATPLCTCEHPFNCQCGNRPPRPSRGHKWDPDTQTWGGKGHKQKGASGQTATVGKNAETTAVGKTTIAQWQRLPSQLLQDYCQRQKRPHYKATNMNNDSNDGMYKYRVIVKDSKDSDKDMFFVPKNAVSNEEQAKEEACLLALLQLTPELPHERKLPDPYKQTWLNAIQQQKQAVGNRNNSSYNNATKSSDQTQTSSNNAASNLQTSSTSKNSVTATTNAAQASNNLIVDTKYLSTAAQKQLALQKRQARNARIRHHENVRLANLPHPVHLCATLRRQIQAILRGEDINNKQLLESEVEVTDPENDAQAYVEERLYEEGFTHQQVRKAYNQSVKSSIDTSDESQWESLYEKCLQWLLVHLDEDDLPEGFDPRSNTLEIISANGGANKSKKSSSQDNSGIILTTEQQEMTNLYSLSQSDAIYLDSECKKRDQSLEPVLYDLLLSNESLNSIATDSNDQVQLTRDENNEQLHQEIEALQAIFADECTITKSDELSTLIAIPLDNYDLKLSILVKDGAYPTQRPTYALVSGQWPKSNVGVVFHIELTKYMLEVSSGEPMMFSIHSHVQMLLETLDDLPVQKLQQDLKMQLNASNNGAVAKLTVTASKANKSEQVRLQRRIREQSPFWSKSPDKAPPAISNPSISDSLKKTRQSLPAYTARTQFLSLLNQADNGGRVLLVTGDTGCGKTTQIPQYILEEFPSQSKIVVCQPRRLAATGVATRVAEERGEKEAGKESVGYSVRGDGKLCHKTRLLFCTTGVLLRQMQRDDALNAIDTIVIDEVHERNLDTDILMGILKQTLPKLPHLRLVLMSATLDADRFASYWGVNTPRMHIPGRTFPVTSYMLEDVLEVTGYVPKKKKGVKPDAKDIDKSATVTDHELKIAELTKRVDSSNIDYDMLGSLVAHIVRSREDDGSILVFLPGVPEINKALDSVRHYTKDLAVTLLPLHGGLQPSEQNAVFRSPPKGYTKIIASTNVAETSITIPDCTVVVDTCREKQSTYDVVNRMPMLVEQFCSKASMKQRSGRAGRVRDGRCYKLVSKLQFTKLIEHAEPEIKRVALDQTLLSLMFLGLEDSYSGKFMKTLLDPPSKESIESAYSSLERLGAISTNRKNDQVSLLPLGLHLAGIPAPPTIGKLLILGSILGCRQAALAMAAGMSAARSPWLRIDIPRKGRKYKEDEENDNNDAEIMKNERVIQERQELYKVVGKSDHLHLASAFMHWQSLQGGAEKRRYCDKLGLNGNAMWDIDKLRSQLEGSLTTLGYNHNSSSERNSSSWSVLRAVIVSALSPGQLVKVVRPAQKYESTAEGAVEKQGKAVELKFFIRIDTSSEEDTNSELKEERVFIHPSSANFSVGNYTCPWLVYHEMIRTTKPFLRDVSECSAYPLLLFGGDLDVKAGSGLIVIDGWCTLSANARIGSLIGALRERIDDLLREKIVNTNLDIASSDVMQMVVKLIVSGGLLISKNKQLRQ